MTDQPTSSGGGATALGWVLTLTFNVVLPIVTYDVLSNNGMSDVPALLLSGVWPVVELAINLLRMRKVDEFSVFVIILLVIGVITSLAFNSPKVLLIKESALTGLFGIVLLGSLLASRPLMFYFGRRFATGGAPERIEWWNGLWQYEGFRRGQRRLTVVWGVSFLGEAVLRILLTFMLPVSTMVVINNVLPYVVLVSLIVGTTVWGKRQGARNPNAVPPPAAA